MAFESYLQQGSVRPTRGRRITYTVSLALHGAAVLAAVAYSFWHVDELSPPSVTVTFVSAAAAPPPPPPPPPLGGGAPAAPKHKVVPHPKVEIAAKVPEMVQPKVEQKAETMIAVPKEAPAPPKSDTTGGTTAGPGGPGVPGGVKGGAANGVAGGVEGGTGIKPTPTRFLPPRMGEQQKLSGAQPEFPTHLAVAGARYQVMAKICVNTSGAVESVTLLKRAHPTLDTNVAATVKTWRFRPLMANGIPVPFCYFGQFDFKSE
ncbi:MAG: energy transducer TonB [Myxococcales bacterium]